VEDEPGEGGCQHGCDRAFHGTGRMLLFELRPGGLRFAARSL
jgi:hypothetical protein